MGLNISAVTEGLSSFGAIKEAPKQVAAHECLHNHTNEFNKEEVIQVTENVFLAIGFGLANSALIVGEDGCTIVDTMESIDAAKRVKVAFEKYMEGKPIKACIYTHNHADHVGGTSVFLEEDGSTEIWAHELCEYYMRRIVQATGEVTYKRAMRQFGPFVPEEQFINSGIGPYLDVHANSRSIWKFPTHTFKDRKKITVGKEELELVFAPGETNDQLFVWYEKHKILFAADNIYKAFPNIYAIRGTPSRDAMQWARSLDKIRELKPERLVLGHTRPIEGQKNILEIVTAYRDAIQYIHDQTLRLINKGIFLDDIVDQISLPADLQEHEYLQQFYGMVEWTVRAVFNHYLGWFGGDPAKLRPLNPKRHGELMLELVGGEKPMVERAETYLEEAINAGEDLELKREKAQWALELLKAVLDANPNNKNARKSKAESLRQLATCQIAATGRNYYLTQAMEVENTLTLKPSRTKAADVVDAAENMYSLMQLLSVRINPEKCPSDAKSYRASFVFPDVNETIILTVRRGICIVEGNLSGQRMVENACMADDEDYHIALEVKSQVWREIISKRRAAAVAVLTDVNFLKGNAATFANFMLWFDTNV